MSTNPTRPAVTHLTTSTLDVLIIGGGIVGSGIARDAAMRGLPVGLVDQQDFAAGTSSRSSRMLHGGLRYLEQGRVGLVREASVEKKIVSQIAPHLAEPLGFLFPAYRGTGRPLWQLRIGVKLYDLLCGGRNFRPSRGFTRAETQQRVPALRDAKLAGSVRYFDALTNDARLVIDTLRSAQAHGATLLNYVRFNDATRRKDHWQAELTDLRTGRSVTVAARTIVNASGPWANQLPHSAVKLRLSKGIHIVIDRKRLPVPSAVVITEGKRILFVLPWGERVIIGTTDTDYQEAPEAVRVNAADVSYVLKAVNEFFPRVGLSVADVISSWAGVRPLIANPDGSPSDISRAHEIKSPEPGWWDVAGGKLTTYRLMAEQTVDQLERHLQRRPARCRTAAEPLLHNPDEYSGIVPPACTRHAVTHFVENEWAVHLDDVLIRRSSWHYYTRDRDAQAELVATWMAELAGWSDAVRQEELAAYRALADAAAPAARTVAPASARNH
jgi:glycerol-3-phosphate dehydrogenase